MIIGDGELDWDERAGARRTVLGEEALGARGTANRNAHATSDRVARFFYLNRS